VAVGRTRFTTGDGVSVGTGVAVSVEVGGISVGEGCTSAAIKVGRAVAGGRVTFNSGTGVAV
jgi:hypothetical protein